MEHKLKCGSVAIDTSGTIQEVMNRLRLPPSGDCSMNIQKD